MECEHEFEIINIGSYDKQRTIGHSCFCSKCSENSFNYRLKLEQQNKKFKETLNNLLTSFESTPSLKYEDVVETFSKCIELINETVKTA